MDLLKRIYAKIFGVYSLSSLISKEIEDEWMILDVGCGRTSSLIGIDKGSYRIGLDIYTLYIHEIRGLSVHNAYVLGDARVLPFKSKSFDCAVATEILEHLDRHDGLAMITEIERVVKKKILMTTPNGFLPTYAGPEDNPEEKHLCGYTARELEKLGFKVYGFHGLRTLWKVEQGQAVIRLRPRKLFIRLMEMSQPFVYCYPSLAFQFFLIKDVENKNEENQTEHLRMITNGT